MPKVSSDLINADVRNQVLLERLKVSEHEKFQPFLRRIEREVRLRIGDEGEAIENKKRLNALLVSVGQVQKDIYDEYLAQLNGDLSSIAEEQAKFEAESYQSVVKDFESVVPDVEQVVAAYRLNPMQIQNYAGDPLVEPFLRDFSRGEIARVRAAIQQGYFAGQTNAEIVRAIRGTKRNNYNDGILATTNRNALTVVRTSVQHAATQARQAVMSANSRLVKGYEWVSTLDSRTSAQCFTGATKVTPCFDIERLYRAKYFGEIVTITLSTGEKIEGTPNHPVLTCKGWTPLGEVDPCKHVVYSASDKVVNVVGNKCVGVETTFSELYNSISKSPTSNISSIRSSATDFYGDGVGLDGEISIVDAECHLGCDSKSSRRKGVKDKLFGFIAFPRGFFTGGDSFFDLPARLPVIKAAKFAVGIIKSGVDARLGNLKALFYFRWPKSIIEHSNNLLFGQGNGIANITSSYWLPDTQLVEKACDSRGGSFVALSDTSGRFAVEVSGCNVVRKSTELKSCHVYTLQCSQGYYIAGGIIVKNCKSLDGRVFKVGEGVLPPLHPNCRSVVTPVLSERFDFLDEGATRPAVGENGAAQVSSSETYYSWLKKQPASFQDEAIGATRGRLLRNGGLTSEEFARLSLDRSFKPLTLDEMRRLQPLAFERAGI